MDAEEYDELKAILARTPTFTVPEFLARFPGGHEPGRHSFPEIPSTYTITGYLVTLVDPDVPDEPYFVSPEEARLYAMFPPPPLPPELRFLDSAGYRDFIYPYLPGPREDYRRLLQASSSAAFFHRPGLYHVFLEKGLLPNQESGLKYALPIQMTGRISLSPYIPVTAGLDDIWYVLVPAHECGGARIEETEFFFVPP